MTPSIFYSMPLFQLIEELNKCLAVDEDLTDKQIAVYEEVVFSLLNNACFICLQSYCFLCNTSNIT